MTNEEAIRRILEHKRVHSLNEPRAVLINEALDLAIKALEKRPQGEWIYDEKLCNWKCSKCFETPKTIGYVGNRDFMNEHFKYCNHCGAKMEVKNVDML